MKRIGLLIIALGYLSLSSFALCETKNFNQIEFSMDLPSGWGNLSEVYMQRYNDSLQGDASHMQIASPTYEYGFCQDGREEIGPWIFINVEDSGKASAEQIERVFSLDYEAVNKKLAASYDDISSSVTNNRVADLNSRVIMYRNTTYYVGKNRAPSVSLMATVFTERGHIFFQMNCDCESRGDSNRYWEVFKGMVKSVNLSETHVYKPGV